MMNSHGETDKEYISRQRAKMKPMLAAKLTGLEQVKNFPVLITPKLDGVRCLIINREPVTRSLKPVPNEYIYSILQAEASEGLDGELIIPGKQFNEISSAVMSRDGEPKDVEYWIFDKVPVIPQLGYRERIKVLNDYPSCIKLPHSIKSTLIIPILISDLSGLYKQEEKLVKEGYEGIIIRSIEGMYKYGRSTIKEGGMLKYKRFEDAEAKIIGFEELMVNRNPGLENLLGYIERSSSKEGLVPGNTLGALIVSRGAKEFSIGTGFSARLRKEIWQTRSFQLGRIVKYKWQRAGSVDKPRFPVFIGFRSEDDIGEYHE